MRLECGGMRIDDIIFGKYIPDEPLWIVLTSLHEQSSLSNSEPSQGRRPVQLSSGKCFFNVSVLKALFIFLDFPHKQLTLIPARPSSPVEVIKRTSSPLPHGSLRWTQLDHGKSSTCPSSQAIKNLTGSITFLDLRGRSEHLIPSPSFILNGLSHFGVLKLSRPNFFSRLQLGQLSYFGNLKKFIGVR